MIYFIGDVQWLWLKSSRKWHCMLFVTFTVKQTAGKLAYVYQPPL